MDQQSTRTAESLPAGLSHLLTIGPVFAGRPLWIRYLLAAALVGAVAAARFALIPLVGAHTPLLPFLIAVYFSAYLAGCGPGLLATASSAAIGTLLLRRAADAVPLLEWEGRVALFVIVGALISVVMQRFQRVAAIQYDTLLAAKRAEEHANISEAERKAAAQALQSALTNLSLALRAGRAGSFEWNLISNVSTWSPELQELHGFKAGEFGGRHADWIECIDPADRERVLAAVERGITEGIVSAEYRIHRHDTGEVRWMHGRAQVICDEGNRPERMTGIAVDITELKRAEEAIRDSERALAEREHSRKLAEEKLQAADRRKDEFLAMLAHELRNPIAPIRNVANLLSTGGIQLSELRRVGELLVRQTSQLAHLVDDLLDAARITRGVIELKKTQVSLQSIIDTALETVQPMAGLKRQIVSLEPLERPFMVVGDCVRLRQVFENLLTNAVKYSPDRAVIRVFYAATPGFVAVHIKDEGAGIDSEILPHIFELFMQADRSLDRTQGGLGIGLTIVKHLVELHGGSVEARSEGLGHGSELIVRLPIIAPSAEPPPATPVIDTASAGRRVLIVEDNVDSAETLSLLLSISGHEVRTVHDGPAALEALETFAADVALLDIGLPGMDGYVVAQEVRRRHPERGIRLYALTGYGRDEDRALALAAGFDQHLTKPVDPSKLLTLITQPTSSLRR